MRGFVERLEHAISDTAHTLNDIAEVLNLAHAILRGSASLWTHRSCSDEQWRRRSSDSGAGWWCQMVMTDSGAGWWCQMVVTDSGAGWWCQMVVTDSGAGWWCQMVVTNSGAG